MQLLNCIVWKQSFKPEALWIALHFILSSFKKEPFACCGILLTCKSTYIPLLFSLRQTQYNNIYLKITQVGRLKNLVLFIAWHIQFSQVAKATKPKNSKKRWLIRREEHTLPVSQQETQRGERNLKPSFKPSVTHRGLLWAWSNLYIQDHSSQAKICALFETQTEGTHRNIDYQQPAENCYLLILLFKVPPTVFKCINKTKKEAKKPTKKNTSKNPHPTKMFLALTKKAI